MGHKGNIKQRHSSGCCCCDFFSRFAARGHFLTHTHTHRPNVNAMVVHRHVPLPPCSYLFPNRTWTDSEVPSTSFNWHCRWNDIVTVYATNMYAVRVAHMYTEKKTRTPPDKHMHKHWCILSLKMSIKWLTPGHRLQHINKTIRWETSSFWQ